MTEDKILNLISNELNIDKSSINFVDKGSEADVYSFIDKNGKKKIIKIFSNKISKKKSFEEIEEKSKITEKLIQNTIKTLKISKNGSLIDQDGNEIYYQISNFMEYNLYNAVIENKINYYESYLIALKVLIGVCSLHKIGIAHRDIKLGNIMLNLGKEEIKIIDFGFIDKVEKNKNYVSLGTKKYAAPELFFSKVNDKNLLSTDIYSLGILFFTLFTGLGNLMNFLNEGSLKKNCFENRLKYLNGLKNRTEIQLLPYETQETRELFLNLTKQMLSIEPEERPTINEVLERMTGIFLKIEENRKKQKIEENASLKPREKIMIEMFTNKKIFNINQIEFENIAEKNTEKIRDIMTNTEVTNNLKNCVKQSINKILNDNIFQFEDEGDPEKLDTDEKLKLAKIKNHLKEMVFIKNTYYLNELQNKEENNKFFKSLKDITDFAEYNNKNEKDSILPGKI